MINVEGTKVKISKALVERFVPLYSVLFCVLGLVFGQLHHFGLKLVSDLC